MGAGQGEGHTESECTSMPEGWPTKHDTQTDRRPGGRRAHGDHRGASQASRQGSGLRTAITHERRRGRRRSPFRRVVVEGRRDHRGEVPPLLD